MTPGKLDPKSSKLGKEIVYSRSLHPEFISYLGRVARVSELKGYDPFNWLEEDSPVTTMTVLEAGMRHLTKALQGEDINIEHKTDSTPIEVLEHHLAYAAYNMLMAVYIIKHLPSHDDRPLKRGTVHE